jgi:hypothetical protein
MCARGCDVRARSPQVDARLVEPERQVLNVTEGVRRHRRDRPHRAAQLTHARTCEVVPRLVVFGRLPHLLAQPRLAHPRRALVHVARQAEGPELVRERRRRVVMGVGSRGVL